MGNSAVIPPPPEGFSLDAPVLRAASTPPPPEGFTLDVPAPSTQVVAPATQVAPQPVGPQLIAGRDRGIMGRIGDVFSQSAIGEMFAPKGDPTLAALDKNRVPIQAQPLLKLSALADGGEAKTVTEGATRGVLEGLEGFTSAEGLAMLGGLGKLGKLKGVGQAATAAIGAGFDVDMIKGAVSEIPEAKALWDAGQTGEAARVAIRSLMSAGLGAAGARQKVRALAGAAPIARQPLTSSETATVRENVADVSTKKLAREAKVTQDPVLAEIAGERKAASVPPPPEGFVIDQPGPKLNRAQRRAMSAVPEEGPTDLQQRVDDVATEVAGKPLAELPLEERAIVEDLAAERLGGARDGSKTPGGEPSGIDQRGGTGQPVAPSPITRRALEPLEEPPIEGSVESIGDTDLEARRSEVEPRRSDEVSGGPARTAPAVVEDAAGELPIQPAASVTDTTTPTSLTKSTPDLFRHSLSPDEQAALREPKQPEPWQIPTSKLVKYKDTVPKPKQEIESGQQVPDEVLADYPNLKPGKESLPERIRAGVKELVADTSGEMRIQLQPEKEAPAKKKVAVDLAEPPLITSPSYEKTKGKILEKVNVSEDTKAELSKGMADWEKTSPERKPVTFEDIRKEAAEIDPALLMYLKKPKAGETLNPALRFAAREQLNSLTDEIQTKRKGLIGELSPNDRTAAENQIERMEADAKNLLDVLIPTRSQDGRNLAYHRMMAGKASFDTEYWLSRARRSMGLSSSQDLPQDVHAEVSRIISEGREAERIAASRIEQGTTEQGTEVPAAGPKRNRNRVTVGQPEVAAPPLPQETGAPDAARRKAAVDADPKVREKRLELARKMQSLDKVGVLDTITAFRRAGLLTGPRTHLRNIGGNTAFQAMEEISRIPASIADFAMSKATGRRTTEGGFTRSMAKAGYKAATEGIQEAKQILRKGGTPDEIADPEHMIERTYSGGRLVNNWINGVFRTLKAEDRVFRKYAFERSIQEQMKLAGVDKPTEAMQAQAIADAEFSTFNNKNIVADAYQKGISSLKQSGTAGKAAAFAADTILPFVRTPANIVARAIDYTPVGAAVRVGATAVKAAMNKSFTPEQQRAVSMAIGRGATGSALLYIGWKLAEDGLMTGTAEEEPGLRKTQEAAGRSPGAIRVGDNWHQVSAFSPLGTIMTIGATLQREASKPLKDEGIRPEKIAGAALKTVKDYPFLQGMKDVSEAIDSPGARMESFVANTAGSMIPTAVSEIASLGDDVRRENKGDSTLDSIAKGIAARLPGARQLLPEKQDVLGRKVEQKRSAVIDPTLSRSAREKDDPVLRELVKERVGVSDIRRQTGEALVDWRLRGQVAGKLIDSHIREVVNSSDYEESAAGPKDETRRLMLKKAITNARNQANDLWKSEEFQELAPPERRQFLKRLLEGGELEGN